MMFLLLRRGSLTFERSLPLSWNNISENYQPNVTEKTCLLCKRLNGFITHVREQSSVSSPSVKKMRKKWNKKLVNKAYTDILVVNKQSSLYHKANVTKLKPSDLNLLVASNIDLNELYKIKDHKYLASHTYDNLVVEGDFSCDNITAPLDIISTEVTEELNKTIILEPEIESELEFKSLSGKNSLQPEEIEDVPELTLETTKNENQLSVEKESQHQQHRDTIAAKTLAAYVEVCNHQRNPNRGLSALHFHQLRSKRKNHLKISSMTNLQVYHTILKGFANKGDYTRVNKVLSIIREEKVELDLHCFNAILECLGRININNFYLKDIRIWIREAQNKSIHVNDIMNKGIFLNDEREYVLKAIKADDPLYVPKYEKPNVFYENPLVDHLNDDRMTNLQTEERLGRVPFISKQAISKCVEDQLSLEEKSYITIKSIERKDAPDKETIHYRETLNDHYKLWSEAAFEAFIRDLSTVAAQRSAFNLEPYLRSIPVKDIVEIIVQEATKMAQSSETYSPEVYLLYKMLGSKVYNRYRVICKEKTGVLDKTLSIHKKFCENYAVAHTELDCVPDQEQHMNLRSQWQFIEHEQCQNSVTLSMGHQPWVPVTLTAIGKFLYHIIMHDLKIDVNSLRSKSKHKNFLPAFYTIFRSQGRIVKEEVKPHPVLFKLYKLSQPETLTFPIVEVPMLCPPIPWTSLENGGYLISPTDFVRLPPLASTQRKRMADSKVNRLYPNFDALNQLSSIPWKVNTKLLDVILKVFRSGGSAKLDVPEPPSSLPPAPQITPDMDKTQRYQMYKQKLQLRRKKAEMYSLWCDCLYRLSLANHFRDEIFWLPHNMDFRGRVYPVPPHLNHLGSDLARSMLVFGEARPLGPNGLDWLKIHLINLTGLKKKESIQARLDYANEIIHLILDSADNPLNGQKWWAQSDEPWQTLACCMEIANVIRSGQDPALYRSHFPVHQDGSCNGLQHYAALGRDSAGAFSVNLAPSLLPQDVYSAVVNLVENQRSEDEANGVEIAKILNGFVKRKVIKQTIMTTVYGVTRYGARLQIAKQLNDIDDFPKDSVWSASSYLAARTFESLRSMFSSAREIQDWFTECARLISGVNGALVEWVTPMGLPVVQPYIKHKKTSMPSGYEGFCLDQFEKPNVMKQKNAFPPNFVHSLDSSHMMLTSLHSARSGITFVSVHDCYWTHPSTIQIMNKICREQFVALHSQPILENLSVFLYDLYAHDESAMTEGSMSELSRKKLNKVIKRLPKTGDFDIKNVLNSVYFFS
ncbi:hypothetical protein ABEB36_010085 [Hypothenemus hampei]|uniref:DNA-directed RNA polymerase n=1 Tax=Hypothenemus hampei TaxID=57062 RepID=A0ABD1EIX2_HYPHA